MPSRYEHCLPCELGSMPLSPDPDVPMLEDMIVRTHLADLDSAEYGIGVSPVIRQQGVTAAAELASKACANRILEGGCDLFEYVPRPVVSGSKVIASYILLHRG